MGFCFFFEKKDNIKEGFKKLASKFCGCGRLIKHVCCDNGGEYEKHVKDAANDISALMEFFNINTSQFIGIAKQRFETFICFAVTMLNAASLNTTTQNFLQPEAAHCINVFYNNVCNTVSKETLFEFYVGCKSNLYSHLFQFGCNAYVDGTGKAQCNWSNWGFCCMMVGYASAKSTDTYCLYNSKREKVIIHCDVTWSDWIKKLVSLNIDLFQGVDGNPGLSKL